MIKKYIQINDEYQFVNGSAMMENTNAAPTSPAKIEGMDQFPPISRSMNSCERPIARHRLSHTEGTPSSRLITTGSGDNTVMKPFSLNS